MNLYIRISDIHCHTGWNSISSSLDTQGNPVFQHNGLDNHSPVLQSALYYYFTF